MNKTDLIDAIAQKSGLTKTDSKKALDAFTASITSALKDDERVTLVGFGTFYAVMREERIGRNPQTKQEITIPARKVVKFKGGIALNDAIQ